MFGAIIGDICGSYYESRYHNVKDKNVPLIVSGSRFTDDTVLTVAIADAILHDRPYANTIRHWYKHYPNAGFGRGFREWMATDGTVENDSFGNGAAMRVSPVAWAFEGADNMLKQAELSARPSHAHPEGIKGAQAAAMSIYMARKKASKAEIRHEMNWRFGYNMDRSVDSIRKDYRFSSWAQNSVPEAIICFLESRDFEDAIRNAISLGGDADTQAAIAGSIAEAFYGTPDERFLAIPKKFLPMEMMSLVNEFRRKFIVKE